jgi:hypothetical protein
MALRDGKRSISCKFLNFTLTVCPFDKSGQTKISSLLMGSKYKGEKIWQHQELTVQQELL